jgi:N-acetylneuraminic acid mutarotase
MQSSRCGVDAVLLDGNVYIIGGLAGTAELNTVEMIDLGGYQKSSLPSPISDYESVESDGIIYIMGGSALINDVNERSNIVYMYNPLDDTWSTHGTMPVYAKDFSLTSAYGKIYLFGGMTSSTQYGDYTLSNQIYEYDPDTNNWTAANTLSSARYRLSSCLFDEVIYITGGINSSGYSNSTVETYNPLSNTVTIKNSLPAGYENHNNCVMGDSLYLLTSSSSDMLKYTGSSDTWSSVSPSGSYSGDLFSVINDYLYVLGSQNDSVVNPSFYKYFPADNTCTYYTTFNYFGKMQQVVEFNNKAYILTGNDTTYSTELVEYTPPSTAWSSKANLNTNLHNFGTAVLDVYIYIAGGCHDNDLSSSEDSVYKYDESTDTWTEVSSMTYPRHSLGLAGANGKLYAIGGYSNGYPCAYVEEYNPSTNSWTTKSPIPVATMDMAIASYNGIIYIFGGRNSDTNIFRIVRAYNPSTDTWSIKTSCLPTDLVAEPQ